MSAIAEVFFSMGRCHLRVCGFVLATEGDKCRDGGLPESVLPAIPQQELEHAMIGDKRAADLPIDIVRFFRGDCWNETMMRYVAAEINKRTAPPTAAKGGE